MGNSKQRLRGLYGDQTVSRKTSELAGQIGVPFGQLTGLYNPSVTVSTNKLSDDSSFAIQPKTKPIQLKTPMLSKINLSISNDQDQENSLFLDKEASKNKNMKEESEDRNMENLKKIQNKA